jgi:alanyl-tRNA synthetase
MTAEELRRGFIEFFIDRGHREIASASLIPENDPSVLFTTAGMHPLVPYLLGARHPMGNRLAGLQKCIRTDDIEEVGDDFHHTFFEMLGNWSLGDYFKEAVIGMSYRFLTEVLSIPKERLAVTVFEGTSDIPRDNEASQCWTNTGLEDHQIYFYGMKENWWGPAGMTGPCGPDTEIFFDTGKTACGDSCGPACGCGKFVEIWNNVFMQYNKQPDGSYTVLQQKNVDTGMGLERILAVVNGKKSNYETELFTPILYEIEALTGLCYSAFTREFRIIADHMRAVTFILGDHQRVVPSNTGQGYILRRLIRRVIRMTRKLGVRNNILPPLAETVMNLNAAVYPELKANWGFILEQLDREFGLFVKTLDGGLKMAEQYLGALQSGETLSGELVFRLFDTFGFPPELTEELAIERGITADLQRFQEYLLRHQAISRNGTAGIFKGGLADQSEQTARLHTATHLLGGALRKVLGDTVSQRGSNITAERLRFDFSFDRKLTHEELKRVSDIVNEAISGEIDVVCEEMTVRQAAEAGAVGMFERKYSEVVTVYAIGGYSKEICGGPHAGNTRELNGFSILKEEGVSAGVRRIKAVIG